MATHSVTQNDDDDADAATHPLRLFEGGRVSVCELYAKKIHRVKIVAPLGGLVGGSGTQIESEEGKSVLNNFHAV